MAANLLFKHWKGAAREVSDLKIEFLLNIYNTAQKKKKKLG
jgi:hypothetical protein